MGATCLDGQWSPSEIPSCHQMQHPNIKWVAALTTYTIPFRRLKVVPQIDYSVKLYNYGEGPY